ncbi:cyclin-dependent kinase inhibitor [Musa troglodytarum]|uniref:Cyclin-dependent kinase inhibitor n=1 Tax=Musa troglodytarum TaxID=320322 RepID=A0A9E7L8Z2_9LILI|nr:cyclin-dependent kinase inhibitor [Musa troglodytarum]
MLTNLFLSSKDMDEEKSVVTNPLVIKIKQLPVVLVSFSLGSRGCMYKVLQVGVVVLDVRLKDILDYYSFTSILSEKMQQELGLDKYRLIRECICGQIYDSATVDFTGKMATRFLHHHTAQRLFSPTKITSWMRKVLTSALDVVLPSRSEAQRAEYWQSLCSSVAISMGPLLIFSSEDDDLAPYQVIFNFSLRPKELGVDAGLVKWSNSPHVGES